MIYRDFKGLKLSALGFGCMRLPTIGGDYSTVDEAEATKMFDYAIAHGVNYFDTAWGYHDGASEPAAGRILKKYPRESYYLATKFPGYDLANMPKVKQIFAAQLEKCGTDYFDFYLFHNVCEMNIEAYLDEKYGIFAHLSKMRDEGKIRHLGFSAHGALPVLERFLKSYGKDMEFCQLQINYVDWTFQGAKDKVELLKSYNIPVWVMEPLRGGKLARLSPENEAVLKELRPDEGIPAWAFRFLLGIPEVKVILSGMSDFAQVKDNIATFESERPLSENEREALLKIGGKMYKGSVLPCTACRYCTSHCPRHLNIPELINLYNEHKFTGGGFIAPMALSALSKEQLPSACISCHSCEKVCPQQIKIADMMKDFTRILSAE